MKRKRLEISFRIKSCMRCANLYGQASDDALNINASDNERKPEIMTFLCPADGRIVEMSMEDFCGGIDPDCPLPDAEGETE